MSKKHYEVIANAIAAARGDSNVNDACDRITNELANAFAADNSSFTPSLFRTACGIAN